MPFSPADAHAKTHKAQSPTAKRQWSHVVNSAMERGAPEGQAIREANGVIRKRAAKSKLRKVMA